MFRFLYYSTLLMFLFGAIVFWVYADVFFNWLYGINVVDHAASVRENFVWGVVWVSAACLVLSILAISKQLSEKVLAYMSLLMSAITIVMFVISFFGHGVIPTRGII